MTAFETFAGFVYCDGFPFGGDDGTAAIVVIVFLAFAAALLVPIPKAIPGSVSKRAPQRLAAATVILGLIVYSWIKGAAIRHDFMLQCSTAVKSTGAYMMDMFGMVLQSLFFGALAAVMLKLFISSVIKIYREVKRRKH
jgi:hypothetical protein